MAKKPGRSKNIPLPLGPDHRAEAEAAQRQLRHVVQRRQALHENVMLAAQLTLNAVERLPHAGDLSDIRQLFEVLGVERAGQIDRRARPSKRSRKVVESEMVSFRPLHDIADVTLEDAVYLCGLAQLCADTARGAGIDTQHSGMLSTCAQQLAEELAALDYMDQALAHFWRNDSRRESIEALARPSTEPQRMARLVTACEEFARAGGLSEEGQRLLHAAAEGDPIHHEATGVLAADTALLVLLLRKERSLDREDAAKVLLDACALERVSRFLNSTEPHGSRAAAGRALAGVLFPASADAPSGETWARGQGKKLERLASDYMKKGREAAEAAAQRENGD